MKPILYLLCQKRLTLTFIISAYLFCFSFVQSQDLFYDWHFTTEGTEYEYIDDIQIDNEGNVIGVGRFESNITLGGQVINAANFSQTGYLFKLDSSGKLLWHIILPVGEFDDVVIFDLEIGINNEIILVGSVFGDVFTDPSSPSTLLSSEKDDGLVVVYDKDGNHMRSNLYAGPNSSERFFCMDQSSDGEFFAAGYLDFSTNENDDDAFIVRLDTSGSIVWNFLIDGDGRFDGVNDIKVFNDHFYITGSFEGDADFDPSDAEKILDSGNGEDIFIAKYTLEGRLVWAHNFGNDVDNEGNIGRGIYIDKDENIYICGEYEGNVDFNPSAEEDILELEDSEFVKSFILKMNSQGEFIWAKKIESDRAKQILEDKDGSLILLGRDFRDLFFQKFNPEGELIWYSALKTTDSSIDASSFALDDNGNLVVGVEFFVDLLYDPQDENNFLTTSDQQDIAVVKLKQTSITSNFNEETELSLSIFPNPTNKVINIKTDMDNSLFQIFDSLGKQLFADKLSAGHSTINVPYPPGFYFFHFINGKRKVVKKIQIL